MPMSDLPTVPVVLRVHLAHALLQAVADNAGVDVLHIKGPSFDPTLRPADRTPSIDADLLVRPSHLRRLTAALRTHGWVEVTRLRSKGVLHHSTNWYHPELGQADLHVRFPGIQREIEAAFDTLWQDRTMVDIAHRPCTAPDAVAQRLIVLLHAAREPQSRESEIGVAWGEASDEQRVAVRSLAKELDAEVALAAAIGELDAFRHRREYSLWRLMVDPPADQSTLRWVLAKARAAPANSPCVTGALVARAFRGLVRRRPGLLRLLSRPRTAAAECSVDPAPPHQTQPKSGLAAECNGRAR